MENLPEQQLYFMNGNRETQIKIVVIEMCIASSFARLFMIQSQKHI